MTQAELDEYIAGRLPISGQRKLTRQEIDEALDSLRRQTGLTKESSMTTPRTTYRKYLDCQNEEVVERVSIASNERSNADPLPAELRELIIRRNPPLNDDVAFLLGQLVKLREQLAEQRSRLAAAIARAAAPPPANHSAASPDWIAALKKPYFPPV